MARAAGYAHDDSLTDKLSQLAASAVGFARGRLDLLRSELHQEGERLGELARHGLVAAMFGFLALQAVALGVVTAFWETPYRFVAILFVALAAAAAAAWGLRSYRAKRAEPSSLLAQTTAELARDEQALSRPADHAA